MATNPSAIAYLPLTGGAVSGTLTVGGSPLLLRQATTGLAGFALQNATPTVLTYTTPNDGAMHRVIVTGDLVVASLETGGALNLTFTDPASNPRTVAIWNGGLAAGVAYAGGIGPNMFTVAPNTAVSLVQGSALTAGASTVYAELWGI